RPGRGLVQARDRAQQRGFARAIRADDRVDVTGEYPQAHPGQGAELAVVHGEVAHLQQRVVAHSPSRPDSPAAGPVSDVVTSVPRNTSRTAGLASTSAGLPSPMKEPAARQTSRSTAAVRARTTCSIQITATPSARIDRTIPTS